MLKVVGVDVQPQVKDVDRTVVLQGQVEVKRCVDPCSGLRVKTSVAHESSRKHAVAARCEPCESPRMATAGLART